MGMNAARGALEVSRAPRVLIASGASAGHLYPSLAFAESLSSKKPESAIAFVSVKRGMKQCLPEAAYQFFFLSLYPFSFNIIQFLRSLYYLARAFIDSFFLLKTFRPDVVVGFGSYVSFPVLLEAALLRIPTLIHEQNVSFGLANKILRLMVKAVAVSFAETTALYRKCILTGNPLRRSLVYEDKAKAMQFFNLGDSFTLLAVGGSQGSHRINQEFRQAVKILAERKENFQFIHIAGLKDYFDLKEEYKYITIKHCVFDYFAAMHLAYSAADLVICRAGAGTLAELAYFKKAAILIPYPRARGHQLINAQTLKRENAAVVIEEKELNSFVLSEQIMRLMHTWDERKRLEDNIQKFAPPDAGHRLAEVALSLAKKNDRHEMSDTCLTDRAGICVIIGK